MKAKKEEIPAGGMYHAFEVKPLVGSARARNLLVKYNHLPPTEKE